MIKETKEKENTSETTKNSADIFYCEIQDKTAGHKNAEVTSQDTYEHLKIKPLDNKEATEHPYQEIKLNSVD